MSERVTGGLAAVVAALACPHDGGQLVTVAKKAVGCVAGHRFDIARQGYVNLLAGPAPAAADTAAMVAARERVQAAGLPVPLTDALVHTVREHLREGPDASPDSTRPRRARLVVDLGAGTGHHLAAVVEGADAAGGLAVDISKHAARRAARSHLRVGAVVADVWARLPIRDGAADVVLDVFAPRNVAEMARILEPGGVVIIVTPQPDHLTELVGPLGLLAVGEAKLDRLDEQLTAPTAPGFDRVARTEVRTVSSLPRPLVADVVGMGPNAHHLDVEVVAERLGALPDPMTVTYAVTVSTYRRR